MEGTSSVSKTLPSTPEDRLLVDDFFVSGVYGDEEKLPISGDKYAEVLQLQEVLYSSAMSRRVTNEVIRMHVDAVNDTLLRTLKGKQKETGHGESSQVYCGICMDVKPGEEMFSNQNCSHSYCHNCVGKYVAAKIHENILMVQCPHPKCNVIVEPRHCRSIIPKEVFDRWEKALCENVLFGSQKFYCPFKDCSAILICDAEKAVTASVCPHCSRLFCAQCRVSWHAGIDCKKFQSLNEYEREREDLMLMELAKQRSWTRCPNCKIYVEKIGGCSHVSCRCGNQFCYGCGYTWSYHHVCVPQQR